MINSIYIYIYIYICIYVNILKKEGDRSREREEKNEQESMSWYCLVKNLLRIVLILNKKHNYRKRFIQYA